MEPYLYTPTCVKDTLIRLIRRVLIGEMNFSLSLLFSKYICGLPDPLPSLLDQRQEDIP